MPSLNRNSSVFVGGKIPNFSCDTHLGQLTLHDCISQKFCVLISFAKCEHSISTTEVGALTKLKDQFKARDVILIGLVIDTKDNIKRWVGDISVLEDCGDVPFPIISDNDGSISAAFGIVRLEDTGELRISQYSPTLTMVIDFNRDIRYMSQYSPTCGRNIYEVLRIIDSTHLTLSKKVSTPANWQDGQDVFVNDELSDSDEEETLFKGIVALRPWFRVTPQPDI